MSSVMLERSFVYLFIGFCYHMALSQQTCFISHLIKNALRIRQHKLNATD